MSDTKPTVIKKDLSDLAKAMILKARMNRIGSPAPQNPP
jgi:hypothetical protein